MKNFFVRAISGIIYVFLIVVSIVFGPHTFLTLFSIITFLCLREFYGLINIKQKTNIRYFHCLGGVLLFVSTYLYALGVLPYHHAFLLYLFYIAFVFISELYKKHQDPIAYITFIFLGQCYIALPLSLLNIIAFTNKIYSSTLLLALFVFIWVNDSAAYIIGTRFGKHRLFKRISPKKSWEGFWGGLIFTLVVSCIFAYCFPVIPSFHWIGIASIVAVFGTWGDLVESLIKRTWKIKDSGIGIPGHGGFLDRFDSLLFAVYALLFYIEWFIR